MVQCDGCIWYGFGLLAYTASAATEPYALSCSGCIWSVSRLRSEAALAHHRFHVLPFPVMLSVVAGLLAGGVWLGCGQWAHLVISPRQGYGWGSECGRVGTMSRIIACHCGLGRIWPEYPVSVCFVLDSTDFSVLATFRSILTHITYET